MNDLNQLLDHARQFDNFEDFEKDYHWQIRHGQYWHVTDNPQFFIDPQKGPRDMSSMSGGSVDLGSLMITSHLEHWHDYYNFDEDENPINARPYAVEIDMSGVPLNEWKQVGRGFGNEFFIHDASKAKVKRILPIEEALRVDEEYFDMLPRSTEELYALWEKAHQNTVESAWNGIFLSL